MSSGTASSTTRYTLLAGLVGGIVGGIVLLVVSRGSALVWLPAGAVAGVVGAALLGPRAVGPGRGLMWGLGTGLLAWLVLLVAPQLLGSSLFGSGEQPIAPLIPWLVALLLSLAAPIGVVVGIVQEHQVADNRTELDLPRALLAGGTAGVVGGWVFGVWMAQAGMLPLVAQLVGASGPEAGQIVHFGVAVTIGVSFALLFQQDVLGFGSSLGWGLAYGLFWWLLGGLTLFPLLLGNELAWTAAAMRNSIGTLVGHAVYGIVVGVLYAIVDRLWLLLFYESDPLNREVQGPTVRALDVARTGAIASLGGVVVFGFVLAATGDLVTIARLVGLSSPLAGFAVHLVIGTIIGATYAILFRYESPDVGSAVAWGVVYGLVWWFLGPLTLLPTLLGAPLPWTAGRVAAALPSLLGHFAYGATTGLAFAYLLRSEREWAAFDSQIAERIQRRRRKVGTPAPAVWVFTLGIGVFVLVAIL